jgi:hypothetical protein
MKRTALSSKLGRVVVLCGGVVLFSGAVAAQSGNIGNPVPPYNPYPPGILPSDLASEIASYS